MATTPTPAVAGRSSAQYFLEEHDQLVTENEALRSENVSLNHDNQVLLSEVNMLREELARADKDRLLLHGFFRGLVAKKEMVDAGVKMLDTAFKEAAQLGLNPSHQPHQPEPPNEDPPIEEPSKVILSTTIPEIEEKLKSAIAQNMQKMPPVRWQ